jgi:hypothetical protein
LANFDVTSFACYLGSTINNSSSSLESDQATLARFITEGFFLSHVKRMRERPTRRPGDHQRLNTENKNDADEDQGDA